MQKTTDLETIRNSPHAFTWGYVREFYDIGRYCIVEYEYKVNATGKLEVSYHTYIDGKDTRRSFGTLDRAIIGAVAYGNLEANEARFMATAAHKIFGLGMDE